MGLLKRVPDAIAAPGASASALVRQRLEVLLTSGGDARLNLIRGRNAYGCTPFPRAEVIEFASSTASSISEYAYARASEARSRLWTESLLTGSEPAFEAAVERSRAQLRRHLGLQGAQIVFSPSGTDVQLKTLFLAKAILGAPLTTIIVGADQTGSGTVHTARGEHFSHCTASGAEVAKGQPVAGLAVGLRTMAIGFCDENGHLRSAAAMDDTVRRAVLAAIGRGEKVLLQTMASSKFGQSAPSDACIAELTARWPDAIRVVVDACQMRLGHARYQEHLSRGHMVAITGSKFFTGPAFSGALLIPSALSEEIAAIENVPEGLCDYSVSFDWPQCWPGLRAAFSPVPRYGQWLRWEAALAEMDVYFKIPPAFRDALLGAFAAKVRGAITASPHLELLAEFSGASDGESEFAHQTIFAFQPNSGGTALSTEQCGRLYRAMGEDVSRLAAPADQPVAARLCQIGQPVPLHHRPGAALRISASARLVTRCWQRGAATLDEALAPEFTDLAATIEKLNWLIDHIPEN